MALLHSYFYILHLITLFCVLKQCQSSKSLIQFLIKYHIFSSFTSFKIKIIIKIHTLFTSSTSSYSKQQKTTTLTLLAGGTVA